MELANQLILNTNVLRLDSVDDHQPVLTNDLNSAIMSHQKDFNSSLNRLFCNDHEESQIAKARSILGDSVAEVSDDDLAIYLTEIQYLLDEWLDTYEKQLFDGQTLRELQGKG